MPNENSKETGYIKLWRDLTYSKLWNNINCEHFKIAIEILELAKFKRETIELLNGEKITLEPGQLITTKKYLSDRSGETSKRKVSEKAVRGALTSLKKIDFLDYTTIKSIPRFWVENEKKWADVNEKMGRPKQKNGQTKKQKRATVCTLITVENWEFWQGELKNGQTKTEEWADVNEKMGRPKNENGQQYKNDIFKEYNNMSDSKESDHSPGAFKSDNNNSNKTNENTITTKSKGEKEKEKNSAKKKEKEQQIKEVVEYLNLKANRNYRPGTTKTKSLISARLKDYSVEDLKAVIDFKVDKWLNAEWYDKQGNLVQGKTFLRPSTLFNETNFENYINELPGQAIEVEEKELPPITAEEFYDI